MEPRRRCRFSRSALLGCAALIALSALPALCAAAEEQPALPNKPDLDVTYISQRPLYHGYWMDYPNDVPTFWVPDANAPDGKRTVTKEEWQRLVKYQPAAGDKVTFTAHVRNNGFAPCAGDRATGSTLTTRSSPRGAQGARARRGAGHPV